MTKKTRLTILLICVASFFVIAPVLVLYSMGDRFDFEKMKITATGGIYVRTFPAAEKIIIDSKTPEKPGIFSNSIFVQSLLPSSHTVLIEKSGYYDYFKTLPVQENQVTKLENVILFKKDVHFEIVSDQIQSPFLKPDKFLIKNNNLYYSTSPENIDISATLKATPVLKGLVAFLVAGNNILWLGTDGFLYQSDLAGIAAKPQKTPTQLILAPLKIIKTGYYKIVADNQNIFVINNGSLLHLNAVIKSLDNLYIASKDAKISPGGKNIVYYNDNNIYISELPIAAASANTLLYKSSEKINDVLWLNNDYIIFNTADKIMISEIDYRGNVNIINLPQTADKIFFNSQDSKLYILTNNILLSTEKLIP